MTTHRQPIVLALALAITALLLPRGLAAQVPDNAARMAPADAGLFLQVHDLASLITHLRDDPLSQRLQARIGREMHDAWTSLQVVMGMDSDELLRRFFAGSVVVIAERAGDDEPGVILTRAAAADQALLRERLGLIPLQTIGRFQTFITDDHATRFAMSDQWLMFCGAEHEAFFNRVLEHLRADGAGLAGDANYQRLVAKLPPARRGLAFARNEPQQQHHALGLVIDGNLLHWHYAGQSRDWARLIERGGDADALQWPAMPDTTLAVAALNLKIDPLRPQVSEVLDRTLAPNSTAQQLVNKLGHAVVFFLGEVPGNQINPDLDLAVPAIGLALRVKDPSAIDDLDQLLNRAVIFANMATFQWNTPPIEQTQVEHAGVSFRIANVGPMLADRTDRDELEAMRVAYGRVGDWYILTTQDVYFRQLIDAHRAGKPMQLPLPDIEGKPLGAMIVQPDRLAAHLQTWIDHWRVDRPELIEAAAAERPTSPEARLARGVLQAVEHLRGLGPATLSLQSDNNVVIAHLQLPRPPRNEDE